MAASSAGSGCPAVHILVKPFQRGAFIAQIGALLAGAGLDEG